MPRNMENDCRKCAYFQNHDTYRYFGFCADKNELKVTTQAMEVCDGYKEISLEDLKRFLLRKGWIRCLSCNKTLYTVEELVEHLEGELGSDLFSDVVASEEAPTAS